MERDQRAFEKSFTVTTSVTTRCLLKDLKPDLKNIKVIGLVVGKCQGEMIHQKDKQRQSYVFNLVLRDSFCHFTNVSIWGRLEYIRDLLDNIDVNTPIVIENPLVKANENGFDFFRPVATIDYSLVAYENCSKITSFKPDNKDEEDQCKFLESLSNKLIRDPNDYYVLADLCPSNENLINNSVNLLFVIREFRDIETIQTKNGKELQKMDVYVCDNTAPVFKLTLWDREQIKLLLTFTPMHEIVFGVDLSIKHDKHSKTLSASATSKSLFIRNPDFKPAYILYKYAKTAKLPKIVPYIEELKSKALNVNTLDELKFHMKHPSFNHEYILVNAVITSFNIDVDIRSHFIDRCKKCYRKVEHMICANPDCRNDAPDGIIKEFEIGISVSDHTTTLDRITLNGRVLDKCLNGQYFQIPLDLLEMSVDELTMIKWKLLLERCEILLKVRKYQDPLTGIAKYSFRVVNMEKSANKNDEEENDSF